MKAWEIVHECDNEEGKPSCWAKEINHHKYGKYVWITDTGSGFNVEVYSNDLQVLIRCKSLSSAKRWVSMNL